MKSLLFCLFIGSSLYSMAQQYSNIYVDQSAELKGQAVNESDEHGIVIAGYNSGAYVMRIDSVGDIVWQKNWNMNAASNPNFEFYQVLSTSDTAFLIVGKQLNSAIQKFSAFVMKIDLDGNLIWEVMFDNGNQEDVKHIAALETVDSSYVISWGTDFGNQLATVKLDLNGSLIWSNSFENTEVVDVTDLEQLNDSTYLISSNLGDPQNLSSSLLCAMSSDGTMLWNKSYADYLIYDLLLKDTMIYIGGREQSNLGFYSFCIADSLGSILSTTQVPEQSYVMNEATYKSKFVELSDSTILYSCSSNQNYYSHAYKIENQDSITKLLNLELRDILPSRTKNGAAIIMGNGPTHGIKSFYIAHIAVIQTDSNLNIENCGQSINTSGILIGSPIESVSNFTNGTVPDSYVSSLTEFSSPVMKLSQCVEFIGNVTENEEFLNVKVYPNFSDGIVNFEWDSNAPCELKITSLLGTIVHTEKNAFHNITIDLANCKSGMYQYELIDNDGKKASGKLILQ